jgi:hypothetical protein
LDNLRKDELSLLENGLAFPFKHLESSYRTLGLSSPPAKGPSGKKMSLTKKTATYAGTAAAVAIVVILAATIYVGAGSSLSSNTGQESASTITQQSTAQTQSASSSAQTTAQTTNASQPSTNSVVLLQLTDPPTVPVGASSLNLTYSAITLLASEPGQNGQVTTTAVTVTPSGGSATVDLLRLENISQTIASTSLPSGSTIYSATFTVSSISITINGTTSAVSLATGGSSFVVSLTSGTILSGTNAVLLDLNPTVVDTPSGYEMIPSSVGIILTQSEVCPQGQDIGRQCPVTGQTQTNIKKSQVQLTSDLLALSVSGSTTTVTVQIGNPGNSSIQLIQIGLQGNLTVVSSSCTNTSTTTTTSTASSSGKGDDERGRGQNFGNSGCWNPGQWGPSQLLFTPVNTVSTSATSTSPSSSSTSTSTASTGCTSGQMVLSNGAVDSYGQSRLVLGPGQCVILTFSGLMTFGHNQLTLVPNTAAGQVYLLNVVGTRDSQANLSCTLPLTSASCTTVNPKH